MALLSNSRSLRLSLVVAALFLPSFGFAASTWNFSNTGGCTTPAPDGYGNSWACTPSAAPTATVTALSTTGSGATFAAANVAQYTTSGFGVRNTVEGLNVQPPDHSLDNSTNTDLLQLSFGRSVALTQVALGWYQGDSDISVLRYTGSTAPAPTGKTVASLLTSGWSLVGNYLNVGTMANATANVNAGGATSSWWIISAYNAGFGGSTSGTDSTADYIKVLSVAGTAATPPANVPEPASLSMASFALLALFGVSRRARRKSAAA